MAGVAAQVVAGKLVAEDIRCGTLCACMGMIVMRASAAMPPLCLKCELPAGDTAFDWGRPCT